MAQAPERQNRTPAGSQRCGGSVDVSAGEINYQFKLMGKHMTAEITNLDGKTKADLEFALKDERDKILMFQDSIMRLERIIKQLKWEIRHFPKVWREK